MALDINELLDESQDFFKSKPEYTAQFNKLLEYLNQTKNKSDPKLKVSPRYVINVIEQISNLSDKEFKDKLKDLANPIDSHGNKYSSAEATLRAQKVVQALRNAAGAFQDAMSQGYIKGLIGQQASKKIIKDFLHKVDIAPEQFKKLGIIVNYNPNEITTGNEEDPEVTRRKQENASDIGRLTGYEEHKDENGNPYWDLKILRGYDPYAIDKPGGWTQSLRLVQSIDDAGVPIVTAYAPDRTTGKLVPIFTAPQTDDEARKNVSWDDIIETDNLKEHENMRNLFGDNWRDDPRAKEKLKRLFEQGKEYYTGKGGWSDKLGLNAGIVNTLLHRNVSLSNKESRREQYDSQNYRISNALGKLTGQNFFEVCKKLKLEPKKALGKLNKAGMVGVNADTGEIQSIVDLVDEGKGVDNRLLTEEEYKASVTDDIWQDYLAGKVKPTKVYTPSYTEQIMGHYTKANGNIGTLNIKTGGNKTTAFDRLRAAGAIQQAADYAKKVQQVNAAEKARQEGKGTEVKAVNSKKGGISQTKETTVPPDKAYKKSNILHKADGTTIENIRDEERSLDSRIGEFEQDEAKEKDLAQQKKESNVYKGIAKKEAEDIANKQKQQKQIMQNEQTKKDNATDKIINDAKKLGKDVDSYTVNPDKLAAENEKDKDNLPFDRTNIGRFANVLNIGPGQKDDEEK